jgi:hypothetical protein
VDKVAGKSNNSNFSNNIFGCPGFQQISVSWPMAVSSQKIALSAGNVTRQPSSESQQAYIGERMP